MNLKTYNVPKLACNYADALAAIGLAKIIHDAMSNPPKITIEDKGTHFELQFEPPLTESTVKNFNVKPSYPYLKSKEEDPKCPATDFIDYKKEQEKNQMYRDYLKKQRKSKVEKALQSQSDSILLSEPRPDFPVLQLYNVLRKTSTAPEDLHYTIRTERGNFTKMVLYRLGFEIAEIDENAERKFNNELIKKVLAPLQLFNPSCGKGAASTKPSNISRGSLPDEHRDWLYEWARIVGTHQSLFGHSAEGQKVFVIAPRRCQFEVINLLRIELLKDRIWGNTKAEILSVIGLAIHLIEHSKEYTDKNKLEEWEIEFGGKTPSDIIAGLHSAYFMNLGPASATMNQSFLSIPSWFPIKDHDDASNWINILREHEEIIKTLDEDVSEEITILQKYRDFIASGKNPQLILQDFLDFSALYATIILQKLANNKYVFIPTIKNLRRLLMSFDVTEIIDNPGFGAIADAVRNATINAQLAASKGEREYEIHYGLAQEWKRQAKYPEQFAKTLAEFVASYNYESVRKMEQGTKYPRKLVTKEELNAFFELMKKHDPTLVASLLLAYGFARDPKEKKAEEQK